MLPLSPSYRLKKYWSNQTFSYGLLIAISMIGAMAMAYWAGFPENIASLTLGIIAAALAETDDNFWGRIRAILLTFFCFTLSSTSTALLFPYPIVFTGAFLVSCFAFIMLGAIGPRYTSIAFGSLLISIYTMLGMDNSATSLQQTFLLLSGSAWYYFLSMIWQQFWPTRPVQHSLACVFDNMASYLDVKSELFKPNRQLDPQPFRVHEAELNAHTVTSLETTKNILLKRSKNGVIDGPSDRFLRIYFLAQDIHERISSTHYRYQELSDVFERSDILFRFKYVLAAFATACREISHSLTLNQPYEYRSSIDLDELRRAIHFLEQDSHYGEHHLIAQIQFLFKNLCYVDQQLANISNPDAINIGEEIELFDDQPKTLNAMWKRVWHSLDFNMPLCRHAIRLSLALTIGYIVIQLFDIPNGYWIILTTLFVCQPNFGATKQRLLSRTSGTLMGLALASLLLAIIPSYVGQMIVLIVSAVLFFAMRINAYNYATAFITVLALFCFAQVEEGYVAILPRLLDTLIGSIIAVVCVTFIFPDWQSKKMRHIMANAVQANLNYLDHTLVQYRYGKKDSLNYRKARRQAHYADAQLSSGICNMLAEPEKYQASINECFRFLTLSHALLSYISTLGSHRDVLDEHSIHAINIAYSTVRSALTQLITQLDGVGSQEKVITHYPFQVNVENSSASMILQQLDLIQRMLPEMEELIPAIVDK